MTNEFPTEQHRRFCSAFDSQLYLAKLVEGMNWHFDLHSGLLTFGSLLSWQIQLLCTESELTNTWLWAWANTESDVPAHLLVATLLLKTYGEQHGIPELTTPQLPLDQVESHTLALLASGLCEANGYYRCPYEGGALYVLITDENFPKCEDPPLQRIASVFPQAIASLEIADHKEALCGYLDHYGIDHQHTVHQIVVQDDDGESILTATFDEQNRLTHLEAKLQPTPPASKNAEWDDELLRRMLGG
jgi:hypothetical protein